MLYYLSAAAGPVRYLARAVWRRPRLALVVSAVVVAVVAPLATYLYFQHQWQAAQAALAADRPDEARDRLSACLFFWPSSPDVHFLAARAARLTGDVQAAEGHLNQCLKLNRLKQSQGATEAVQLEFLLLRVQTGREDEVAATLIDSVVKDHPESPLILETLARAYMHRFRYSSALVFLNRWIEIRPKEVKAYHWRGLVLERMSKHKLAKEDYERALEHKPDLMLVRLRVAEMLLEDKLVPDALPHLERLVREMPNHPLVLSRLGICRFLQGQTAEARRLLEAAAVHLPNDPPLQIHLARLDLQEGHAADAERRLRKVLEADPSDTEAGYSLVSALQIQGRTDESADALRKYQRYKVVVDRINKLLQEEVDAPESGAAAASEAGMLLLQIGRTSQGRYWLEQALSRDPAHEPAHQALAEHYEKSGDREKAAAHRRRLRSQEGSAVKGPQ